MPTTLALFALFTIAFAACDDAGDNGQICKQGANIGTCAASSCQGFDVKCASKAKNFACGDVSDATLKGKCDADSGTCKHVGYVKVDYTVKADEVTKANVETKIQPGAFDSAMKTFLDRLGVTSGVFCGEQKADKPDNASALTCDRFSRSPCTLQCNTGFSVKTIPTRKCEASGNWTGVVGECQESCPRSGGWPLKSGATTTYAGVFASDQDAGDFTVSVASDSTTFTCTNAFESASCELVCRNTHQANPKTTLTCVKDSGTMKWKLGADGDGVPGTCSLITKYHGSSQVLLNPDETLASVKATAGDATINGKSFKTGLATHLGVPADKIIIVGIKMVTTGRRLNEERRVQIDYSILLDNGDPEGATQLNEAALRGTG